jgi:hypothetical protein
MMTDCQHAQEETRSLPEAFIEQVKQALAYLVEGKTVEEVAHELGPSVRQAYRNFMLKLLSIPSITD